MNNKKVAKPKQGKRVLGILTLICIAAVAVGIIFLKFGGRENGGFSFGNMPGGEMPFASAEGMTAASGVTSVGVTEEVFEVESLTTGLEIEEVYINSNDVITEGTKVLKLSESSVAEAREELEQTLKEADLAYRSGLIEYEQSKITAQYDLDSKILSGEQAEEVYKESLSGLQDSVDRAKQQLFESREQIAEYQSYVSNDSYRSYFKVDEYQADYDETLDALKKKMEEWGVSWSQVTTGQGGGMNAAGAGAGGGTDAGTPVPMSTVSGGDAIQSTGPSRDQIQVLASLYSVLEMQLRKLDQAKSDYEDALVNAAFELQTLELKLPDLERTLEEAEKNYQTQVLQAKVTYEKSLASAESAQSDYEAAIQQAQTTCEKLESALRDAEENLAVFESSVGDGYFYASGSGTVLRTMVRAGRNLAAESIIFMYSNPDEMTVTVSVGQENIASVALEDRVYIQAGEYGGFEGIVTEVNPVSNSDSRTNVTYSVAVRFTGDTAAIPANESVTVVFGMDEEAIQNAISMAEESMKDRNSEESQAPEGMPGSGGGERPEGMPGSGEWGSPEGGTPPWGDGTPPEGNIPQSGNGQTGTPQGSNPESNNPGNQ